MCYIEVRVTYINLQVPFMIYIAPFLLFYLSSYKIDN